MKNHNRIQRLMMSMYYKNRILNQDKLLHHHIYQNNHNNSSEAIFLSLQIAPFPNNQKHKLIKIIQYT